MKWYSSSLIPTAARFFTDCARPLIVGARQIMVGSASGTCRSIAKVFAPVTAARASVRRCGVPTRLCAARGLS